MNPTGQINEMPLRTPTVRCSGDAPREGRHVWREDRCRTRREPIRRGRIDAVKLGDGPGADLTHSSTNGANGRRHRPQDEPDAVLEYRELALDRARDVEDVGVEDGHGGNLGAGARARQEALAPRDFHAVTAIGTRLATMIATMMSERFALTQGRLPKK